jgi:hypothetical protein
MRHATIAGMLLALGLVLAGCAVQGNPNQAIQRPYYIEPEAASLDLNFLPLALRGEACAVPRRCGGTRRGNAGAP